MEWMLKHPVLFALIYGIGLWVVALLAIPPLAWAFKYALAFVGPSLRWWFRYWIG